MSSPNMAETVRNLSQEGLFERIYAPSVVTADGLISAPGYTDVELVAHMFPAPGDAVARLELQSGGSTYEIHVPERDRIRAARKGSQARGTVIVWAGRTYEVMALGEWIGDADGSGGYQQAWAQEVIR